MMLSFASLSSPLAFILLTTSAMIASAVHDVPYCKEDPDLVLDLNPRKNGQPKTCAWLQQQNDVKKNKICNRLKERGGPICPVTCDLCDCPPASEALVAGGNCYNPGLSCAYNYQYMGCNFEDGFSCTATDYFYCNSDQNWELSVLDMLPCVDPVPKSPAGQTCEPCPTVVPAESCPHVKPKPGESCSIDSGVECQYDFGVRGCSADQLECTPSSFYSCMNGQWEAAVASPEPCASLTSSDVCPVKKPTANSPCYNLGQTCNYEYRNLSCNAEEVMNLKRDGLLY